MAAGSRRLLALGAIVALATIAAKLVAPAAMAADLPQQPLPAPIAYKAPVPDWIVTVGLEGRIIPAWPGAPTSQIAFTGAPLFSVRHAGEPPPYFGPRDSFGFDVINLGQLKIGPAVKYVIARRASDNPETVGLGNVGATIQAGAYADYWPVEWLRLHTEVRQGFGGEGGVTGDVFLDAVVPAGQFRWSVGPRVTLASAPAINPYFGIISRNRSARSAPACRSCRSITPAAASIPTAPARSSNISSMTNGRRTPSSKTSISLTLPPIRRW